MPNLTVYGPVDNMLSAVDNPGIRTAIGLGQTDAPTFGRLISSAAAPGGITVINSNGSIGGFILSAGAPGVLNAGFAIYDNTLLVNRLYISASGNVGIGNTSTIEKLDVTGTIRASAGYHSINNYTDASNYDRGVFTFVSNALRIGTENIGAAYPSARPIDFVTGGVAKWQISAAGHLMSAGVTDNLYDIGASGANRPRNIYVGSSIVTPGATLGGGSGVVINSSFDIGWSGSKSSIYGGATDGVIKLSNYAGNDLNRIQLGGTADTHPAIARDGAGIKITGAAAGSTSWIKVPAVAVSALPSASTAGAGARSFVNDALTPVFGSAVTGGGAVTVPVYSTGSAWNVG